MRARKQSRKKCRTRKEELIIITIIIITTLLKMLIGSGNIMPGRLCNTLLYIVYTLVVWRTPPRDAFVLFVRNT